MSNFDLVTKLDYCIEKAEEYLNKNDIRYEKYNNNDIVFDEYHHEQIFILGKIIELLSNGELDVSKYNKDQVTKLLIKIGECLELYLKNHNIDCDFGYTSKGKDGVYELVEKLDKIG